MGNMPDENRDKTRKGKIRERADIDDSDQARKKSKKSKVHDDSDVEEVIRRRRNKSPSVVIDVHASSSEDGDASSRNKSKRKKHSHEKRNSAKETEKRQSKRDNRSRSRSNSTETKQRRRSHESDAIRIKEEKTDDVRRNDRPRNRNDQRRHSPDKRRDSHRNFGGNRRNDDRHTDSRNRDKRRGRPDGPSRGRGEDRDDYEWGKSHNSPSNVKKEPVEKAKPDFKLSGKLTEERNTYKGVVIKYSEPPEARIPKKRWRLYQFKGDETLPTLYIHRQSAYLVGRDRKIADLPVDHPSCSKQHAALQYRLMNYERPNGSIGKQIRLYVIDLESANGTFINGNKIEPKRYVELMEKDILKFGFSSREYVLLHDQSKGDGNSTDSEENPE